MLKKIWLVPIRFYQKCISPMLPPRCRYYPTCSTYALTAIENHGIIKGTIMGTSRILRCHPFVKGGLDYVPSTFSLRRNPGEGCHHDH